MPANEAQRFEALTNAFNHLLQNQDRLEKRISELESLLNVQRSEPAVKMATNTPPPVEFTVVAAQPIVETPAIEEALPAPEIPPTPVHEEGLESKVGLTLVNRIGAITLVLGVAFFFKWAVDNNWIGPAGRVMLGLLTGFATLATGDFIWRRQQHTFAQGITATGIAIIYLSLYAAFDFYHLIPQSAAFVAMVATTAMAGVLALRYQAVAIAALGLAGGYVTPILLSTGDDQPWFLFSYLFLLNFAATELAKRGKWPKLEILSFVATTFIYGGWVFTQGTHPREHLVATLAPLAFVAQRWQTQKPFLFACAQILTAFAFTIIWKPDEPAFLPLALLVAAAGLVFSQVRKYPFTVITAFVGFWFAYFVHYLDPLEPMAQFLSIACGFVLFLGWSYWHFVMQKTAPTTLALSVFSLNGVVFYASAYHLLHAPFYGTGPFGGHSAPITPDHHLWLGPLAALVAGVYLAFALFLRRQNAKSGGDDRVVLLALGIALTFLTLAIPVQFTGFTITIAWAIQGAALTWIAYRLDSTHGMIGSAVVFLLVVMRLMVFEAETLPDAASYSLLWNSRFFTFAVAAVAMLLSSSWGSRIMPPVALANYFAGHFFLLWGLCLEVLGWAERATVPENRLSIETIAISILFGVYAVILVSAGVATRSKINRLAGLGLIGVVVLKLYFFDVWQLGRPYQIAAFVILGILLLSTSFLYSHFRRLIEVWWKDDKTAA